MECFYRKKGGARALLTKEKKGLLGGKGIFFRGREQKGLLSCRFPVLMVDREGPSHR